MAEPSRIVRSARRPAQAFTVLGRALEPGTYQDRARPRGQKYPWVLEDPEQLLWSERAWTIEVR